MSEEEKYYNNLLLLLNNKKVNITAFNILKDYDIKKILNNDKYIKKLKNDYINSKCKEIDDKEFINIIEKNYYTQINKGRFAENLKYYSEAREITPSKMAKKLDIPLSTVFDWYNGVNFPKVCHLYFLTRELNVTYQDLLEKQDKKIVQVIDADIKAIEILSDLISKQYEKMKQVKEYVEEKQKEQYKYALSKIECDEIMEILKEKK